ncbi:tyrosine-type recombinase/integrase [Edwardsiella tarda]|uniref:tyrosine-type recombinase/integrase n=1 Tax=Edwardsiella tarda TaxID=636 RepID=UPI00351C076F
MGQLLRAVDSHGGYHQIQCAFNLMWLTLARPTKAIEAEWSEIDLETALWRIPAERMKKRKAHLTPLPHQAVTLLREMHPLSGAKKHVFPPQGRQDQADSHGFIPANAKCFGLGREIQPSCNAHHRQYPPK